MKRLLPLLVTTGLLLAGGAMAQDRTERLALDGASTSVRGQIKGNDGVQYQLDTRPHQQLTVKLASSNASNYLNVEKEGSAEALCQGPMTGNICTFHTEPGARYLVDVYLMRNAARRGESARYTLTVEQDAGHSGQAAPPPAASAANNNAATDAVAACKSALALKSGVNTVFVLPISHVPALGGYEVFLSLKGAQWLCTTDSRGNVNRLEQR